MKMVCNDRVYLHLVSQRGDLEHLVRDRGEWLRAYWHECNKTVEQLRMNGAFFDLCLDIGSGCGGTDIVMIKLFEGQCCLVDAAAGGPAALNHDEPFGNYTVTREFMTDNGIRDDEWVYVTPEDLLRDTVHEFNVIVSTRSWCFHYAPEVYLNYAKRHLRPGGRLMVDVRRDKPEWVAAMSSAFEHICVVEEQEKFQRIVYRGRTR